LVGHWGWLAGYRHRLAFTPAEGFGVIVLTNADDADPDALVEQAYALVAPVLRKGGRGEAPRADPRRGLYVGYYASAWVDSRVLVVGGERLLYCPPGPGARDRGVLVKLVPAGRHTFRVAGGPDDWGLDGEEAVFELGPDGKVKRLRIGADVT